jgi:hypothetical protein
MAAKRRKNQINSLTLAVGQAYFQYTTVLHMDSAMDIPMYRVQGLKTEPLKMSEEQTPELLNAWVNFMSEGKTRTPLQCSSNLVKNKQNRYHIQYFIV